MVAGLGVGGFFLFSQPTTSSSAAASATASASASATASAGATASAAPVAEPAKSCTYTTSGTPARKVGQPPAKPDWRATYQATIRTNRGDVVIDLLNSKATCTVNSFVYLAAKNYFSNTTCHRLTTSSPLYVLQCGDPTGTGTGGPGYEFASENLAGAKYPAGTLAMAQHRAAGFQRQPVLHRLQELDTGAELHAVRHGRQRARDHPECGQGGHCERLRPRGWAPEGESRHRERDYYEDLSQARPPGQDWAGG